MTQYLWDLAFDELFFVDGGQEILDEANHHEMIVIQDLRDYYDGIAANCCEKIQVQDNQMLLECIPELIRVDVILQLCLIYSLGILENPFSSKELIQQIEDEAVNYFHEYRCFGKKYQFEEYSLLSQIAKVS